MSLRTRWAVAVALAATAASVSNAIAQPKPGQGSLGARIGVPYFLADKDTRSGQRPRLLFQANFQYKMSADWRFATEFGYGWVGYTASAPTPYKVTTLTDSVLVKQDLLTKIVPIDVTLIKSLRPGATKWSPYIGAGATINRMEIVNQRRKIKDPATFNEWVKWAPGVHVLVGDEHFMPSKPTVSLDWSIRWTYLFSKDTKRFPSGFTGNDAYLSANFGVNVYFWPGAKPVETAEPPQPEAAPELLTPSAPEAPAPPDSTPAPPDTTRRAPSMQGAAASVLWRSAESPPPGHDENTFGAFGVTLRRTEDEAEACAIKEKRTTP